MRDRVRNLAKKLAKEYLKTQQSGFSIYFIYPNEIRSLKPGQYVRVAISLVEWNPDKGENRGE